MSSEWSVRVVEIGNIEKHPNADTLSITQIDGGYPCIIRTGEFQEGDLAVYIPVDSVVPDTEEYAFLNGKRRIEAKRLRGIFSMGLLRPIPLGMRGIVKLDDDLSEIMDIKKYVGGLPGDKTTFGGENEAQPHHFNFIKYTDHLPLRKYKNVLVPGEEVILTEKLHGTNSRFCHDGERLWVGSRTQVKKDTEASLWWKVAREMDLEKRLSLNPMYIFFGEIFGRVQDLKYGRDGFDLRIFDVFDVKKGRYLDFGEACMTSLDSGLPWVPVLYEGPWDVGLIDKFANGPSTVEDADCIREGFVVRPVKERWDHAGRVSLKYAGEQYLLRKTKTDYEE